MSDDAELFATVLEYREVFALLKQFRSGFDIHIDRLWAPLGDPHFRVKIRKRAGEEGAVWNAVGRDADLKRAVRLAVEAALREQAEEGSITPGAIATGQTGPSGLFGYAAPDVRVVQQDIRDSAEPPVGGP